jgi:hypothetical protein
MTDDRQDRSPNGPNEDPAGALTQQTEGLDEGVTSAIAGPDWDQELVDDARTSMGGEPLEGEVERGPVASGGNGGAPEPAAGRIPPGRPNAADEAMATGPMGEPAPVDPQAGQFVDDPIDEPESARALHPDVGGPIGN